MITIRPMREVDLEQVKMIENETFSLPWSKQSFYEGMLKENTIYLVAVKEKKIVGYCGLWNILGDAEITNVAVGKEYRNHKIGRTMLGELLLKGKEQGVKAFTLEVRESNLSAIHLYESLGFQSVGIRKDFYEKPRENAIIMWKNLV